MDAGKVRYKDEREVLQLHSEDERAQREGI